MADLYELQLTLNLPDSLPSEEVDLLHWHLGQENGPYDGDAYDDPLLNARGPAHRIEGALVGELCPNERGWSLTVRQEVHPDEFDDLRRLVEWLGARTTSRGAIGYLRFYESTVPDVLIAQEEAARGAVSCAVLRGDKVVGTFAEAVAGL
ncbi:hypothetical protein [Streptomyces sp. AC602_WCS936]|uniref:hypothetical protein n=1 Tax=Streptomyces sp. AC602_WCS936 TaxID=2823685 RepID=UPI001C26A3EF|nr:hypothetical protein [Streptomyces sp. AC602_WCS936]